LQSLEGDSGTMQGWDGGQLDLGCWEGNKEAHTIIFTLLKELQCFHNLWELGPFFRAYKISIQFFDKDDKKTVQVFFFQIFFDKVFDGKHTIIFTLLKELHTEDPNEFRNYFGMNKTTIQSILLWFHLSILISYSSCWFPLSRLFIIMCFCFVNIISSFQNSILIGW
jgi:hypothetical protein